MDAEELAVAVASGFDDATRLEAERALRGDEAPPDQSRTRGFSEAVVVGSFIASCARLAVEIYRARRDRALLVEALMARAPAAEMLNVEKRLSLMARIINALVPESIAASPSLSGYQDRSKQQWIKDWLGQQRGNELTSRDNTRDFAGGTVLYSFSDMRNYCIWRPIVWTPPPGADKRLPSVVRVPVGFVTDLATIPSVFWWTVPPTGTYGHAAILHDWLYWEQTTSREIADKVFDVAAEELGVAAPLRHTMWASVRVFGGGYWQEAMEEKSKNARRVVTRVPDSVSITWEEWRKRPDAFA